MLFVQYLPVPRTSPSFGGPQEVRYEKTQVTDEGTLIVRALRPVDAEVRRVLGG
jgi:hypothetical protein